MTIQVEILHFLHYNPSSGRDFILDCPDYLKELSEDTIIRWQRIGCIVVKISETLNVSLKEALDLFYRSETCRRFHDEETGLYLQGNLYILNDFLAEISKPGVA